ncbi:MAG: type VI secretion system-associated FHA domain protein TagH [Granulosicoccus sp.]
MRLTLRVMLFYGKPSEKSIESDFERFPVVIGRSSNCDFILEDPSKYISSRHAIVVSEGDQLQMQDTSSNGTYINGSTESIGRGNSVALMSGDTVTIGDYVLTVNLAKQSSLSPPAQQSSADIPSPSGNAPAENDPFDPFRGEEHDWTPPSQTPDVDDFWGDDNSPATPVKNELDSVWDDWPDSGSSFEAADPPASPRSVPTQIRSADPDLDWLPGAAEETVSAPTPIKKAGAVPIASEPPDDLRGHPGIHSSDNTDKALNILLRGAGLNPSDFAHADSEQLLETAGMILGQSVDGMMLLLHSRAELKNAIRTDVTRVARSNNNPLKFSHNVDDALNKLLMPQTNKGYQPADDAINEAVDDLKAHQLAMLDGMKAAVRAMLRKFDPDVLEKKLVTANPIAANIPITREAKLWQLFHNRFNDIHDEAMHDFKELFGKEFRKAYDKRIRDLGRNADF